MKLCTYPGCGRKFVAKAMTNSDLEIRNRRKEAA